jgi:hypothetical protein
LYLPVTGNRYNVIHQHATYAADNLATAVTEWAYYVAHDLQHRIGNHHVNPVTGPLLSDSLLWAFTIQDPVYVVDAEALAASQLWPAHVLLNPCKNYHATQKLANLALGLSFPGHLGLKAPAVRSRSNPSAGESNFIFYRLGKVPSGQLIGKWRLQVEFLDLAGNRVTTTTPRVDWGRFRFRLLSPPGGSPAGLSLPAPYTLAQWYSLLLNHL